ncbi:hypothetical protein LCI18_002472 [Fusarium solani-melongenae]|uniref:Uncharacterized protein n=1 Tax=Fusarium solani subsp. cucurbitae TaxID=2747967 RepID=A0ACD3YRJ4_FUSSC|nr:hypothetical protein LCI18_002472 [Fusarium solani-melongenae]
MLRTSASRALYLNTSHLPALHKSLSLETLQQQQQPSTIQRTLQPAPSLAYSSPSSSARGSSVFHFHPSTSIKRPRVIHPISTYSQTRTFTQSRHTAAATAAMSSKLIPSKPEDVMVIRNVTPNIATFSVPFSRYGKIKIGGRGTLAAKAKVTEMGGDVRYIVALDYEHHIFVSEWAKAYPSAKLIGPEGLPEKRAKQQDDPKIGGEEFAVVFKKDNKREIRIDPEFDADFDYEYVDGHANLEIVFLYKPERVVIQADLLFNLPPTEQYSKVPEAEVPQDGAIGKVFACVQNPRGDVKWLRRFNWYVASKDKNSFNESMERIAQWDFVTMIPCHGDVMEGDGKEIFQNVFEWHLKAHK